MNLLMLGGTRFVGWHLVLAALARGHRVSVFTRGHTPDELPPEVERLHGDRDGDLSALSGREWDAALDVSGYLPRVVRQSAELLRGTLGRYLFVSTVSVYADFGTQGLTEDAALIDLPEPDSEDVAKHYGGLKVLCERVVQGLYSDRATVLRPDIVAGPQDYTGRFTYWPTRLSRGGRVLAPGDGQDLVQFIDARDLADFALQLLERDQGGVYNVVGPALPWQAFLGQVAAGVGATPELHWVGAPQLEAAGVTFEQLPLYIPRGSGEDGFMNVSGERARALGFAARPVEDTARAVLAWAKDQPDPPGWLTPEREAELLRSLPG